MTLTLPTLTDEEVSRCVSPDEEAGFGALRTERGHLPLRAMDVHAIVDGLLAEVELSQTFVNCFEVALEATYIFPLPDRAAVTRFRMEVNGRLVEGVLRERGEARRHYQQAIQAGYRASITEEERPGVFTLRVGNLMPGEAAVVRLTLDGPLPYEGGEATFRFPLVVAPRYIPGTPVAGPAVGSGTAQDTDAVPDASRITPAVLLPGCPNPVRLALAVEMLPSDIPLFDFRSSLHAVIDGENSQGVRRITLQPGERLNRDFILRFRLGEKAVKSSLVLRPDEGGTEGTFLLTVVPPAERDTAMRARDVVFVLDRSGSMEGWKMVAARRALARMVDTLTDQDRFAVYAFDNAIETVPEFRGQGLASASDRNRYRAVEFLAKIEPRGGTEMAEPLDLAVKQLAASAPGRDRVLVLVTDGQVGNEDQILRHLGQRLRDLRVFTLGIDQAVNEGFLKRLATLGGGSCELVESEGRLDEVMEKVHRRIGTPVLTNLRLEPEGLKIDAQSVVPGRMPDLFPGAPLLLMGRYKGVGRGAVTLTARDEAGCPWSVTVGAVAGHHPAVASVWARAQIRELEDRFTIVQAERGELEKRIVNTSLRFGVLCRFTAYVAVDRTAVVNPRGKGHKMTQPVETPAGWGKEEAEVESVDSMLQNFEDEADCRTLGGSSGTPQYFGSPSPLLPPSSASPSPASPPGEVHTWRGGSQSRSLPVSRSKKRQAPPPRSASSGQPQRPPAAKKPGLLGNLFGAIFGGGKDRDSTPAAAAPEPVDLTAYRRRALDLFEGLKKCKEPEGAIRLRALGALAEKLEALVEDLKTVGASGTDVEPLEQLVAEIRQLTGKKRSDEMQIAQVWSRAEDVLRAFVGKAGPDAAASSAKPADRGEGFWK